MENETPKMEGVMVNPADIPWSSEGLDGPTIFADAIRGVAIMDGMVRFNLVEHRVDLNTESVVARHVATIVLTAPQFAAWAEWFKKARDDMERDGLIRKVTKDD